MSNVMQFEFRLFGPRRGETVVLNNHQFVNGVCKLVQSSENMGSCARVFSFYRAFARGTPEYDEAVALEEREDGPDKISDTEVQGSDKTAKTGVQQKGRKSSKVETQDDGGGDTDTDGTGANNVDSDRDGHEDSRIPRFPEDIGKGPTEPVSDVNAQVAEAVKKLDPEDNSHWVMTGAHKGKPKLQAVEEAYGQAGLTRQDVESAMPGYTRKDAIQRVLMDMS